MEAKNTLVPRLPRREVIVAAALAERFANPDVAAYGRIHFAEGRMWSGKFRKARQSNRRDYFWHCVGRALGAAYIRRGCPTEYERMVRRDIDAARAVIAEGRLDKCHDELCAMCGCTGACIPASAAKATQ